MDHSRSCPHVLRGGTMTKEQVLIVIAAAMITFRGLPNTDPHKAQLREAIMALIQTCLESEE